LCFSHLRPLPIRII